MQTLKMKNINLNLQEDNIDKKFISKLGRFIYRSPNVDSVLIRIHFKDGSHLGFARDEDEDDFERLSNNVLEDSDEDD